MINPRYLAIAAGKTTDPESQRQLQRIEALARELVALERDFPERIRTNKQARGEDPVRLSADEASTLADIDEDMADIDRDLLAFSRNASSATEILEMLTFELPGAPQDWSWMLPQTHPEDRPLIEEIVRLQRLIDAEMKQYLASHESR